MRALTTALAATAAPAILTTSCAAPATTEASAGSKKTTAAKKQPKGAKIGQAAKDGKFTFVVTKVATKTTKIGNEFMGKAPQGKFILVSVTVTNHGKEAQEFMGSAQKLLAGGKEYSADDEAGLYLESSKSLYEQINPGNKVKGVVVFDVPRTVKPSALELHDSLFSGGVRVNLK